MSESSENLGKVVSIHGVAPVHMQRAAIVAVLSFIFFLAMLVVFSLRRQVGFFILATAFMVVEIFTVLGIFAHRRTLLKIFENGLSYKKQKCAWPEVLEVKKGKEYEIVLRDGEKIVLPGTIHEIDKIVPLIEARTLRK